MLVHKTTLLVYYDRCPRKADQRQKKNHGHVMSMVSTESMKFGGNLLFVHGSTGSREHSLRVCIVAHIFIFPLHVKHIGE